MVGDHYKDKLPERFPGWFNPGTPLPGDASPFIVQKPVDVSRAEFDALKREVEYVKTLLEKAKELDIATG